jgi:type IV secretory pathway ATPase VirB11/archaellum biosynthesis ATPase
VALLGKARQVHVLNDPWPWSGTLHGRPLSLADLVEQGTLTRELVAILSWTIARGASVFAAAGPQGAGKSTVANALLELLPDDAQVYVTAGPRDRIELAPRDAPTYLLINELSAHMSVYLSGPALQRAFGLLQTGVRMVGTLHARTAAEAAAVLCSEAEMPCAELNTAFVFVVIAASWRGQDVVRRVVELGFLSPAGELTPLTHRAARNSPTLDAAGLHALAAWSGVAATEIASDLEHRAAHWS